MPDEANSGAAGANQPNADAGKGSAAADSTKTEAFDTSKLSDEQIQKVLEDQRFWKTPRLVELREKAKKADQYDTDRAKAEEEALKKKGEWEQVAKKAEEKRLEAEGRVSAIQKDSAIMAEAAKQGIKDLDAAKKLIDMTKVTVDEQGQVQGVAEAVKSLITERPFLLQGNAQPNVGSGTNPPDAGGSGKFKMSEINDPVFYAKNHVEIKKALGTAGTIIDDIHR